jgi:hypothetical protein
VEETGSQQEKMKLGKSRKEEKINKNPETKCWVLLNPWSCHSSRLTVHLLA